MASSDRRMGEYLRDYEWARYSFFDRQIAPLLGALQSIIVPGDAKQFPDISFYQGEPNFDVMWVKTDAVILRAGQKIWIDPQFERNYSETKARGFTRGVYWFYDDRATPKAQADLLIDLLKGREPEMEIYADWEYNYGGAYFGLPHVVEFMQRVEMGLPNSRGCGFYTGYYWFVENSSPTTHASQYIYLRNKPLWLAWYSAAINVKIPPPWTDWLIWQYGTPLATGWGVASAEIDMNRFNGNDAKFKERYAVGTPPPPPDVTTQLFDGVTRITGVRHGRKFSLIVSDPKKTRLEVAHVTGGDLRDIVSNVAKRKGAQVAWNGGEWNKYSSPYYPRDYSVSDGQVYIPRKEAVPSLIVLNDDKTLVVDWKSGAGARQALSGLRLIVINGEPPGYLDGSASEYTDTTARSIDGLNAQGWHMRLTVDGENIENKIRYGVTLKQAALIMIEFGAFIAFDEGGGGDTTEVINGILTNVPEDISNGVHVERRIPEFLLLYANTGGAMTDYYKIMATDENAHRMRNDHIVTAGIVGSFIKGDDVRAGAAVADIYTYAADQYATINGVNTLVAKKGDVWRKTFEKNGVALVGWTAMIHKGVTQGVQATLVTAPPPPAPAPDLPVSITLGDDITYAKQTVNITLKPK